MSISIKPMTYGEYCLSEKIDVSENSQYDADVTGVMITYPDGDIRWTTDTKVLASGLLLTTIDPVLSSSLEE